MIVDLIIFLFQIIIVVVVILYLYITFRHDVKIATAAEYIQQISPGLTSLTDTTSNIDFWFYSLSYRKFRKYTLDSNLKISLDATAKAPAQVNKLTNGYYFNFGQQRWEKKYPHTDTPVPKFSIDSLGKTTNSLEQKFIRCYLVLQNDDDDISTSSSSNVIDEVCDEMTNQVFVKTNIRNRAFVWQNDKLQQADSMNYFPLTQLVCKVTLNRYRQYLGIDGFAAISDVDDDDDDTINNNDADDVNTKNNMEWDVGIYFARENVDTDSWKLRECERPNDMIFNGTLCVSRPSSSSSSSLDDIPYISGRYNTNLDMITTRTSELFPYPLPSISDLQHNNIQSITRYYLRLNDDYSRHVNLNVDEKIYPITVTFYKSCHKTICIVGEPKTTDVTSHDEEDGDNYNWHLKQIIDNAARNSLLQLQQNFCPILLQPLQLFYSRTGEIHTVDRPFMIYNNYIFYLESHFLNLYTVLIANKSYELIKYNLENDTGLATVALHNEIQGNLLPHTRKYLFENKHGGLCTLVATFAGDTLFDLYIETRLLVDYLDNIHSYSFYNRSTYPTIADDFNISIWACAALNDVNMEMFQYIALTDLYNLEEYATQVLSI